MALPWRDALKAADTAAAATVAGGADPAAVGPTVVDPAAVSPELKALVAERQRLEARLGGLTGAAADEGRGDPRYRVAPLAERRAEFRRWSEARERARGEPGGAPSTTPAAKSPGVAPGARLRPTPGEIPRSGAAPLAASAFACLRDARREAASPSALALPLRERGRATAEAMLDRAGDKLADNWRARREANVPALGRGDAYDLRARRLLAVAAGSVDELGERLGTLRSLRNLRDAEAAGDERRRERALARLQARRGGEG